MSTYTARIDKGQGGETEIEAATSAEALQQAIDWAKDGDWDASEWTLWVDVEIIDDDGDQIEHHTLAINPPEPECDSDEGHDWQSPIELVGGIEENPGVWGKGGGVVITEVCMRCGCERVTDTWAQRPDTGEQGFTSVSYEPGKHDVRQEQD